MLHEFGDLSFLLLRATNMDNEDEMKENTETEIWTSRHIDPSQNKVRIMSERRVFTHFLLSSILFC